MQLGRSKKSWKSPKTVRTKRRKKYGNNRTVTADGEAFDSAKEARRWAVLRIREKAREIFGLERQVKRKLVVNGVLVGTYTSDFEYWERISPSGEVMDDPPHIVEDVKSEATAVDQVYKIKKALMLACHHVEIRET